MRSRKALINTIFAIILEVFTMISAIIVPKLIIKTFGSETNGLVTSIAQFLAYLKLLESGIGGVVKASLYKPLAEKDSSKISAVVKMTEIFFRKIAFASLVYILALAVVFPFVTKSDFGFEFIFVLVLIIGAGSIAQYYYGITYQLLVTADQKGYIYNIIQIIMTVLNVLLVFATIKLGCSIHVVKIVSSIIFVVRPILLNIYVSRKYKIDKSVIPNEEALKQRWNGVGFSVASFVHKKTDIFLITFILSLAEVSVYSVYSTVAAGLDSVISMTTNSFQAAFGNMIAKKESGLLNKNFRLYNLIIHILSYTLFPVAIVLISSYVELYTNDITDVDYVRPLFGVLILVGEMVFCTRQPYQAVITAAGHYKQTQRGAFIEALLNIIISIVLMIKFGIVGAAIGTLVSMIYRTLDYVFYLRKNIINISAKYFILRNATSIVAAVLGIIVCYSLKLNVALSWYNWIFNGIISFTIIFAFNILFNVIFYKKDFINFIVAFLNAVGLKKYGRLINAKSRN